jgi:hypothetical protein
LILRLHDDTLRTAQSQSSSALKVYHWRVFRDLRLDVSLQQADAIVILQRPVSWC